MNILYLALSALIICIHGLSFDDFNDDFNHDFNDDFNNVYPKRSAEAEVVYQWNQLQFSFPSDNVRKQAIESGNFKPENAIPIDVQPAYYSSKNKQISKTFVTIPRFQTGVPFTLATVSEGANGPVLKAYPSYEMHNNKNGTDCDAITSAFRVAINECNQMWVIDSGSVGSDAQCPPQLLLFDLKTDTLIHRYRFKSSLYVPGASLFITPVVVVKDPLPSGNCSQTMVYVADVNYHGLVVYDVQQKDAWRIENLYMYPDPNYGLLSVAGDSFVLMDGIFGMAANKKNLYFHPLSSAIEYSVPLKVLDDRSLSEQDQVNMLSKFKRLGKRAKGACAASAMDSKNNLYCVSLNPISLIKWNVNKRYPKSLYVDPDILQFVSGMKVVKNQRGKEELWMLSNRYQKLATGTQNFNETNFRIVVISLNELSKDENRFHFPKSRRAYGYK